MVRLAGRPGVVKGACRASLAYNGVGPAGANLAAVPAVLGCIGPGGREMDSHTLDLLEFDKVRELLAAYAACSLGKELARQLEPLGDPVRIRAELALVS